MRRAGERLPHGAHGIPRQLVEQNQRERLIAAMVELVAERGYLNTPVRDVARRAEVSSRTFYQLFRDREHCMLDSFWELFARLHAEIEAAGRAESEAAAKLAAALRRALELLASDPPSARLLTVEILAAGEFGARSHVQAIERLAAWLRAARGSGSEPDPSAPAPEWSVVVLANAFVAKQVLAGEAARMLELEPELRALACSVLRD